VDRLIANRRHTARPRGIDPQIAFSNDASQHATLVEIVAADRPGLLYALASAISSAGCNIVLVLIDTEADKALDVFYVTVDGAKLDTDAQSALEGLLVAACNM
jgi:[protein-PII] uridylyltransferase